MLNRGPWIASNGADITDQGCSRGTSSGRRASSLPRPAQAPALARGSADRKPRQLDDDRADQPAHAPLENRSEPGAGDLSVQQIYRLDSPGVVRISDLAPPVAARAGGLGSGFVIDKAGHILTSNLVISGRPRRPGELLRQRPARGDRRRPRPVDRRRRAPGRRALALAEPAPARRLRPGSGR